MVPLSEWKGVKPGDVSIVSCERVKGINACVDVLCGAGRVCVCAKGIHLRGCV